MKKLFKILLVLAVTLSLVPASIFSTQAKAATTQFTVKSGGSDYGYYKGKGASYVEGRDRVDYMVDSLGGAVFCLEFDKKTPTSSTAYTKGGDLNYKVDYVVQAFYGKGAGAQYMKGDEYKKYFIAQNAIRLVLGQTAARVKGNNEGLNQGHGADAALIDNINNLATAAKNAAKPAVPTLTSALSFSNANLTFTKAADGNYYTQTTKAVASTNGKLGSAEVTAVFPTGISFVNTSHGHLNSVTANQEFQLKATAAAVEGKSISINLTAAAKYELGYPVPIQYVTTSAGYQTVTGYDYDYLNASKTATATAKVDDRRGALKIVKLDDKKNALAGVSFTVANSAKQVLQTVTADAKGEITVSNLVPDTYTVTEVKGKKGYVVDTKPQSVAVKINETAKLEFVNKLMTAQVQVHKVDQDGKPLADATFALTDEAGIVTEQVTNKDGYATFGLVANKVYDLKETKNPVGYHGTFEQKGITVANDGQVFEYTAKNELNKGKVTVHKVDQDGKALAGSEMTLTDNDGKKTVKVTDKAGDATFDLVANKVYSVKETKNPVGYHGSFEQKDITVAQDGQTFEYTAKNDLNKGKVTVHKVDQNGKALAGSEMTLTDQAGKTSVKMTDKAGNATFDLAANNVYNLKETKNPAGYHGSFEQKGIMITSDGQTFTYTATNTLNKGTLTVHKVDQDGKALAGAEMTLTDNDGKTTVKVTDKAGDATFDLVANKVYSVKETKNPIGYHGSFEKKDIQLQQDKQKLSYTAKNTKDMAIVQKVEKLVATGDSNSIALIGLGVVLLGGAVFYLVRRKKKTA